MGFSPIPFLAPTKLTARVAHPAMANVGFFAAVADGAEIIFVPAGNWDEAVEVDPGTVELVQVEDLQDALDYLSGSGA